MGTRRQFSREFELEAVKLVKERSLSVPHAARARDLVVHENVLCKWVREVSAATQDAVPGTGVMKPEQAEFGRLKKLVPKLKVERDILKEAAAHFA